MSDETWDAIEIFARGHGFGEATITIPVWSVATIARLLAIQPPISWGSMATAVVEQPGGDHPLCTITGCINTVPPWIAKTNHGLCESCHGAAQQFMRAQDPPKTWADLEPLGIGVQPTPFDVQIRKHFS